nr:reverse transcriptase domain-containing protein [Tanacetum cinerariifolium]
SSSKLSRDQTSNPTSSTNPTPKGRIRRISKQKVENSNFEEHLPPVAMMTDNRTMAEMLRAPIEGWAGRRWLKKEPPHSITTWDDLVSKFINEFFPPSRTTNIRNEISNFQQKFDESFHEAWERYKDLLRACPYHDFTELHQLHTFYNALNPANQDSLNAAAGGNLLEKSPQDALTIIENKSKQTRAVTTAMLKQLQTNPPPAQVKAVEEICVTCGAAGNYNQGNPGYRPQGVANRMRPLGFAQPNVQNNQNRFGQPQGFNRGTNFNQEQPYQATAQSNQNFNLNVLENIKRMNDVSMKAMQNQIDMVKNELRNEMKTSIQTSLCNQTNEIKNMMASLLQNHTASTSRSGSLPGNTIANPKGELKAITTRSGLVTDGPTVSTPPKSITPEEDECVEETYTDPDLAEYTIKVPPPPVQKPKPSVQRNFVLHTRDSPLPNIPYPLRMLKQKQQAKDEIQIQKPFLRTARALIDVHGEEMILRDGDEILTLNMKHDTTSYSNHPHRESANLINIFNVSSEDCIEVLVSNKKSGNPTFSLHKEITSPKVTHEIHDSEGCKDSDLKDSIDQMDLPNFDDYFVDLIPEMFTDEHAPDYSFPLRFDVYPDDFLEIKSDADNFYDDPFDSKGEKIKESELLIDELDLPCDFLPYSENDSFAS